MTDWASWCQPSCRPSAQEWTSLLWLGVAPGLAERRCQGSATWACEGTATRRDDTVTEPSDFDRSCEFPLLKKLLICVCERDACACVCERYVCVRAHARACVMLVPMLQYACGVQGHLRNQFSPSEWFWELNLGSRICAAQLLLLCFYHAAVLLTLRFPFETGSRWVAEASLRLLILLRWLSLHWDRRWVTLRLEFFPSHSNETICNLLVFMALQSWRWPRASFPMVPCHSLMDLEPWFSSRTSTQCVSLPWLRSAVLLKCFY